MVKAQCGQEIETRSFGWNHIFRLFSTAPCPACCLLSFPVRSCQSLWTFIWELNWEQRDSSADVSGYSFDAVRVSVSCHFGSGLKCLVWNKVQRRRKAKNKTPEAHLLRFPFLVGNEK